MSIYKGRPMHEVPAAIMERVHAIATLLNNGGLLSGALVDTTLDELISLVQRQGFPNHEHYKGGIYELVTNRAYLEKDRTRMCVYRDAKGVVWVRPYSEYYEVVTDNDGHMVPRFKYLGHLETNDKLST